MLKFGHVLLFKFRIFPWMMAGGAKHKEGERNGEFEKGQKGFGGSQ